MTQMQTTWRDVDVSAYVDGELDPAKQVAFEAALAQNHLLRQKVKEMREVVVLIKAAPLREPPRNYLLTPAMVATKAPQRRAVQRPGISLLFMRLATSLAAVAFVVTAGLTYVQRGVAPGMLTQAPKAADEMPVMEAPRAVIVEATQEVELMLASEPEEMTEAAVPVEEAMRAEKVAEAEQPVAALAPAPPEATPQPSGGGAGETTAMDAQEQEEAVPQAEAPAPESVPVAEAQVADEVEYTAENSAAPLPGTGEGEWMGYEATEPTVADHYASETVEASPIPSWWLPGALGAATLLLAGLTYWMSRRR